MPGERFNVEITVPASADLSAFQYRCVNLTDSGSAGTFAQAIQASASTAIIGVLTNKPTAAGQGARVCIFGVTKMEAAGAIGIGALVTQHGAGRGTSAVANNANNTVVGYYLGRALTRAAASGDIFEIFVNPGKMSI